jgi:hypothetical protein
MGWPREVGRVRLGALPSSDWRASRRRWVDEASLCHRASVMKRRIFRADAQLVSAGQLRGFPRSIRELTSLPAPLADPNITTTS